MAALPAPSFELSGVRSERSGAPVLQGVTLRLSAGRVSVLVGPSGSGKTSLLRLLNRLDEPAAGTIRVGGREIREIPVLELRRTVGFVFQEPTVFPGTVEDNLRIALEVAGVGAAGQDGRIEEALRDAELGADFLRRAARELSGGERQRVTLARALVLRPRALLLDEPTSALDPATAERIVATIGEMGARRGITVVVSTHRHEEARGMADFVVLLRDGRVEEVGSPAELLDGRPKDGRASG
jgi:ABC-type proline/glycine betaine transport system ATPase subunit